MLNLLEENISTTLRVENKKALLLELSKMAASTFSADPKEILKQLTIKTAQDDSTLGNGVAVIHLRLAKAQEVKAFFIRLPKAIPFDAIDERDVDLIFAIIGPEKGGSLKVVAEISRLLRNKTAREKLRGCDTGEAASAFLNEFTQEQNRNRLIA